MINLSYRVSYGKNSSCTHLYPISFYFWCKADRLTIYSTENGKHRLRQFAALTRCHIEVKDRRWILDEMVKRTRWKGEWMDIDGKESGHPALTLTVRNGFLWKRGITEIIKWLYNVQNYYSETGHKTSRSGSGDSVSFFGWARWRDLPGQSAWRDHPPRVAVCAAARGCSVRVPGARTYPAWWHKGWIPNRYDICWLLNRFYKRLVLYRVWYFRF